MTARIRGVGLVCALGTGVDAVRAALRADPAAIGSRGLRPGHAPHPAPFDPEVHLPPGVGRRLGRQPAMALAAVREAIGPGGADPETALVLASAYGAVAETVQFIRDVARLGARYASPATFAASLHNTMAGVVCRELQFRGPALVVCNGDASFESALVVALAMLAGGRARRVVVGASEAFDATYEHALDQFGGISDVTGPRPAGGRRLSEGAAALVLEAAGADSPGVRVADVRVGRPATGGHRIAEIVSLDSGDAGSRRRHESALDQVRSAGAADIADAACVSHPAERFGSFAALSAVATAWHAARRLGGDAPAGGGATLLLNAPYGAPAASVVLYGSGSG